MYKKKLFVFIFIQLFLIGFSTAIVGPLIPVLAYDFNIKLDLFGLVLSLYSLGLLVGNIISSFILSKFGRRIVFIVTSLLFSFIFSNIYIFKSFLSFSINYILFGFIWGITYVNLISVISDNSQLNKSKKLVSIHIGFILGVAVAPILVSIILKFNIPWQYLFLFVSLINFFLLAAIFLFKVGGFYVTKEKESFFKLLTSNFKLFKNKFIILCCIVFFIQYGVSTSFRFWFTTYFRNLNMSVIDSSLLLSLYSLTFGLGLLVKSYLVEKYNEKKIVVIFAVTSFVLLLISFFVNILFIKIILIILFAFSISATGIIVISIGIKSNTGYSEHIVSMINSFGYIGMIIFQYIIGYFSEKYSESSLIYISLIALFLLSFFTIFLNSYKNKDMQTENLIKRQEK